MNDDSEAEELIPDRIRELFLSCHEYVRRSIGTDLDDTPETISIVDHYIAMTRDTLEDRPQLLPLVARALAAYLGELIRGTLGGFWYVPSDDAHEWLVCLSPAYLAISPLGIVYDAIYRGTAHDGPSSHLRLAPEDRALVQERLALVPPVPEDEFYLLSTRLEAIEVAVEVLREAMRAGGQDDVFFMLEDYEEQFGNSGS